MAGPCRRAIRACRRSKLNCPSCQTTASPSQTLPGAKWNSAAATKSGNAADRSRPCLDHSLAPLRLRTIAIRNPSHLGSYSGLPAVALSHGWLQPAGRYADTMRYLASWGFVVVAPDTEKGPVPSHGAMARDLTRALHLVAGSNLGNGRVRVDGRRLGVIGHSIGGGAAVLAAADDPSIGAVVTVTAARTFPSAVEAATRVRVPGLHLVGADDEMADGDGSSIAAAWAGETLLRTVKGTSHLGLAEGSHWSSTLSGSGDEKRIQQVARMLATAFLLRHLTDQDQLADELDGKVKGTTLEDLDEVRAEALAE